MPNLVHYAIPAFVALLLLEVALSAWRRTRSYELRDTLASLAMGLGNQVVAAGCTGVTIAAYWFVYEHRLFDPGTGPWVWALGFVAEDFTYYWWHRASHEVRLLWAAHENHHSSQRYNLATALRQSWTTSFTVPWFYLPLPLLGIHPLIFMTAGAVSLLYQFWIHTEQIDRLGPFEWLFNTPSHHRVHHGANVEYLDRNYGGILIVWDRLFGSFEPERAPVRYGLTKQLDSFDPLKIAFHEWVAMLRDAARAPCWRASLGYLLEPPGWSPDGASQTARQLQAARRTAPSLLAA